MLPRTCRYRGSLLGLWALAAISAAAQSPLPPPQTFSKWEFALSLASTTSGQLFSLFVVKVGPKGDILERMPLNRDQFIRQVQGRTFSKANLEGEDLFRTYGVKRCTLPEDSAAMGFLTDCSTLDDLWKLRFWSFPLQLQEGQQERTGWAAKPLRPDDRQLLVLKGYGMQTMLDLAVGENMFRLLRDMGDPAWVSNYRGGG